MRGVMAVVPEHIIEWRKRTGMWQRDEIWDGVLHMSPEPDREHQDFEGGLEMWLRLNWARPRRSKVYHRINLARPGAGSDWIHNYPRPGAADAREIFNRLPNAFRGGAGSRRRDSQPRRRIRREVAVLRAARHSRSLDHRPRHQGNRFAPVDGRFLRPASRRG